MVFSNVPEAICNLCVGHRWPVLLVYKDKVICVFAPSECEVGLMEDEAIAVMEVIVAPLVDISCGESYQLLLRGHALGSEEL